MIFPVNHHWEPPASTASLPQIASAAPSQPLDASWPPFLEADPEFRCSMLKTWAFWNLMWSTQKWTRQISAIETLQLWNSDEFCSLPQFSDWSTLILVNLLPPRPSRLAGYSPSLQFSSSASSRLQKSTMAAWEISYKCRFRWKIHPSMEDKSWVIVSVDLIINISIHFDLQLCPAVSLFSYPQA